ncbi:MAG: aconitase X, partial [Candidatus Odinarchaeia archaeon]
MYLTKQEEKILDGEYGPALQKALKLVVAIGDIFNADKLIDIKSSQISGISYKNIGDAGLELIEDFNKLGGRIRTFATLNPAGMDLNEWKEMGIPEDFAVKQLEIINLLSKMGATVTCTCTPY